MGEIKVGIIGLGGVGSAVKRAFEEHPAIEVAALCDRNASLLVEQAGRESGSAAYSDYRMMLEREPVDLVYLAVPPKFHHPIAFDILKQGKHLLCEKPLANSLIEAEEMLQAAEAAGVMHAMNFPTLYRPAHRAFAKLLQEERLGELRRIEIKAFFPQWPRSWQRNEWISTREQGGFAREVLPHFLHLIRHHCGAACEVVSRMEYPKDPAACETGLTAFARLASDPGVSIVIDGLSGAAVQEEASLTFYGTRGRAKLYNWSRLLWAEEGEEFAEVALQPKDHLLELVDHVVRAIRGQSSEIVTFREGVEVQSTLEALLNHRSSERILHP
ncbi:Gfo/Idh/MocA family protein [Cohnella caldifontis]|uniref:Gfo/Idh/MocA family protein n=1 Tax=Cohnella caldifontis TaxID=3027471 RepID=UPI0023EACFDC|nr:Gfo/Idh/MocA family oxidoreductase [Cohnella sp. YIM B05605]